MSPQQRISVWSFIALSLAIATLAGCGGGGGGGVGGGCTPQSVVSLNYKDARLGNVAGWSTSNIVFPSLTQVRFDPLLSEVCGRSVEYFVTTGISPTNNHMKYISSGLSVSETGVVSGMPTRSGSFSFIVGAEIEGYLGISTSSIEFTVDDFGFSYPSNHGFLITLTVGTPFSTEEAMLNDGNFSTSSRPNSYVNGASNYTRGSLLPVGATKKFSIGSGVLPPGLVLNEETGRISGTPTTAGDFRFSVRLDATYGGFTQAAEESSLPSFSMKVQ